MQKRWKLLLFCASTFTLISWDMASKEIAKDCLKHRPPFSFFHDFVRFEYAENTGAAMSFADDLPQPLSFWLLAIAPLVVLLLFASYLVKNLAGMHLTRMAAFTLIISGGLGNIIDRMLYDRRVTDFMNLGINDFRTGIFNFADVCITAGAVLMLFSLRKKEKGQPGTYLG